jgi:hypothetical protein
MRAQCGADLLRRNGLLSALANPRTNDIAEPTHDAPFALRRLLLQRRLVLGILQQEAMRRRPGEEHVTASVLFCGEARAIAIAIETLFVGIVDYCVREPLARECSDLKRARSGSALLLSDG